MVMLWRVFQPWWYKLFSRIVALCIASYTIWTLFRNWLNERFNLSTFTWKVISSVDTMFCVLNSGYLVFVKSLLRFKESLFHWKFLLLSAGMLVNCWNILKFESFNDNLWKICSMSVFGWHKLPFSSFSSCLFEQHSLQIFSCVFTLQITFSISGDIFYPHGSNCLKAQIGYRMAPFNWNPD